MANVVCPLRPQSYLLSPDRFFSEQAQAGVPITQMYHADLIADNTDLVGAGTPGVGSLGNGR